MTPSPRHRALSLAGVTTLFAIALGAGGPARACLVAVPTRLTDVSYADVVVVGRITNYRIVLDQQAREERRKMLARPGDMDPKARKMLTDQTSFLTDYARFDIVVDEVLAGKAAKTLTATWDASTFGEPQTMPAGPYLIALRDPASKAPPLRGPSATIMPNREPGTLTVVHPPCAGAFIFASGTPQAAEIRQILHTPGSTVMTHPQTPLPSTTPRHIAPNFAVQPSPAVAKSLYPSRARDDEVEGSATVDCVAGKTGALKCKVLSETPRGYGFGQATVQFYQSARLKPGTFEAGDLVKLTRRWMLE